MSQFKVLTIFHQEYEYFHSFLNTSHEFCVFDSNQSLFIFYSKLSFRATTALQR